jgi:hypothetical protein
VRVSFDMYDSLVFKLGLDLRGLSGPKTSSPSPMSFSRGIEIVASSAKTELRADAPGPEKRGAGGSGRLGLPPYREEGVPGLGLPFRSAGSNCRFAGGGLPNSEDPPEGVQGLVGDCRPLEEYGTYCESGGAIGGAVSVDGARECDDVTEGW